VLFGGTRTMQPPELFRRFDDDMFCRQPVLTRAAYRSSDSSPGHRASGALGAKCGVGYRDTRISLRTSWMGA
jgi:hypothetical protein